jgi:cysteine-S-conjugate beta-lyase
MSFDFDRVVSRRGTDSLKWNRYGEDVLPLWVADMDFPSPEPVVEALRERIAHGVFGYGDDLSGLREAACDWVGRRRGWNLDPDSVLLLPGLVTGLNVVCRAVGESGDGVLVNTPVYPPFLTAPGNQGRRLESAEQRLVAQDRRLRYEIDFEALERAVGPRTRLFILCSPHNPTGRVFTSKELARVAEFCDRHDLILCADEIHGDLLLGDAEHTPAAVIDPGVASRTVTLVAPSKSFNIPGLGCSLAIVTDPALRARVGRAARGIVPDVNVLGLHAALAAYTHCDEWLKALRSYLTANRDLVVDFVERHLPGVRVTRPEATYLAWLDCRRAGIEGNPHRFFLEEARVAVNDGRAFGPGGEGFVRLNFGCPRSTLEEALDRMRTALQSLPRP